MLTDKQRRNLQILMEKGCVQLDVGDSMYDICVKTVGKGIVENISCNSHNIVQNNERQRIYDIFITFDPDVVGYLQTDRVSFLPSHNMKYKSFSGCYTTVHLLGSSFEIKTPPYYKKKMKTRN